MRSRIAVIVAGAVLTSAAGSPIASQSSTPQIRAFRVEDSHSSVTFSIGFLGFPVRGRFDDVRGTLSYASGDLTASSISVVIPVKSLSTGSDHRDEHLRSADFFDADKFPYIVFRSETVSRSGSQYVVTGPLTMHGVTKTVSIPFTQVGSVIQEPHGSTLVLFRGGVRLARKDFGIAGGSRFNSWFDDVRSATMADSVDVALEVQGWDPDYTRNTQWDRALTRIAREGVDSVIGSLRAMRAANPDTLKDAEWELSQIAKALLVRGRHEDALRLMRFNADVFNTSPAVHCALAEALGTRGARSEAVALIRRVNELDAYSTCAMELARRLSG